MSELEQRDSWIERIVVINDVLYTFVIISTLNHSKSRSNQKNKWKLFELKLQNYQEILR